MLNQTTIKKRYTHDRMSISVNFPSGANLKFMVGRTREKLELAFSNDIKELKKQHQTVLNWVKLKKGETIQSQFDRIENISKQVKSGAEFILAITK